MSLSLAAPPPRDYPDFVWVRGVPVPPAQRGVGYRVGNPLTKAVVIEGSKIGFLISYDILSLIPSPQIKYENQPII